MAPLSKNGYGDLKDSSSKNNIDLLMDNYGSNNYNKNDYSYNKAYLENLNNYNYQPNNIEIKELKPIENKKLLLKYSGNKDSQPKKLFEKDFIHKEKKYEIGLNNHNNYNNDIEEDIEKEPIPISKAYLRDPIRDRNEDKFNNLKKFNVIKPISRNYDGMSNNLNLNFHGNNNILNRDKDIGNIGLKKKNFMDAEKDILGMIKSNLEKDVDMRANNLLRNRDYSLNDNQLHRNYQINPLNPTIKDKAIANLNLNNANNFTSNYNPVLTNLNNKPDLNYKMPSRNFDLIRKEKEKKEYDSLFNKNENFNSSKRKWDYDLNNNLNINNEYKKQNDFVVNSRRKLNPINRRSKINDSDILYSGKKDDNERIDYTNIINNDDKNVKFESRRQHVLQKI